LSGAVSSAASTASPSSSSQLPSSPIAINVLNSSPDPIARIGLISSPILPSTAPADLGASRKRRRITAMKAATAWDTLRPKRRRLEQ
jgi:hypothetical protein